MVNVRVEEPKTLFEIAALRWLCVVEAHGLYLHEKNFDDIMDTIKIIGRRLEFSFDHSCLYLEVVECVVLRCIGHLKPEFVDHWSVSTYHTRSTLTTEAYHFGLGQQPEYTNQDEVHEYMELWDGSELSEVQNSNEEDRA